MLTLRSKNLFKTYKGRTVVNDVSVEVKQGEIVGLLGPNGAGKTTSFYQIVGLVPPDKGEIYLGDQNITDLPMYKRAQLGVGYLPQEASVFRNLSVEDNIAGVLEMTKLSKHEQKERLELLLSEFGLNRVRTSMGNVLSGGERRRTEIARALATDPKFILLDEPFAGIDPIAVEDIQRIVEDLKKRNIGVLITDHNVQETLSITDRAYLLFEGKILKAGTAEELASDEQVRRVYLGQNFVLRKRVASNLQERKSPSVKELTKYTNDIISIANNILRRLNESADSKSILSELQDFERSLREYKIFVSEFARNTNNSDVLNAVNSLTSRESNGDYLEAAKLLVSNWLSVGLSAQKQQNYLRDCIEKLNRINAFLPFAQPLETQAG